MSREHLATYLNDHLAGSVIALDILEHLAAEAADLKPEVRMLKTDIERDRKELQALMNRLGISESRTRKAGGWIAEKFTEVKLEVDDESGGHLRRLERLEALALGLYGKAALWDALNTAAAAAPELRGPDYEALKQRADDQRRRVEILRLQAAKSALTLQSQQRPN